MFYVPDFHPRGRYSKKLSSLWVQPDGTFHVTTSAVVNSHSELQDSPSTSKSASPHDSKLSVHASILVRSSTEKDKMHYFSIDSKQ